MNTKPKRLELFQLSFFHLLVIFYKSRAKRTASRTCSNLSVESVVNSVPILPFDTVINMCVNLKYVYQ